MLSVESSNPSAFKIIEDGAKNELMLFEEAVFHKNVVPACHVGWRKKSQHFQIECKIGCLTIFFYYYRLLNVFPHTLLEIKKHSLTSGWKLVVECIN